MKQYDPKKLTEAAVKLYHAATGVKPTDELHGRIQAGVEGLVQLYNVDPKLMYAVVDGASPILDPAISKYAKDKFGVDIAEAAGSRPMGTLFRHLGQMLEEYSKLDDKKDEEPRKYDDI